MNLIMALMSQLFVAQAERDCSRTDMATLQAVQDDIRQLKLGVDRWRDLKEKQTRLVEKIEALNTLKNDRILSVKMLDELAKSTPEKLKLNSLSESAGKVRVSGVAVSNPEVSKFLKSLEKVDIFTDVYLNTIETDVVDGIKMKIFSLSMPMSRSVLAQNTPASLGTNPRGGAQSNVERYRSDCEPLHKAFGKLYEIIQATGGKNYLRHLDEFENRIRRLELQSKHTEASFVKPFRNPTDTIKALSDNAIKVGLEISKFHPIAERPDPSNPFVSQFPIRLVVEGRFHQLTSFLYKVSQMDAIVHVKDMDLSIASESNSDPSLQATFELVGFRLLSDKEREMNARKKRRSKRGKKGREGKRHLPQGAANASGHGRSLRSIAEKDNSDFSYNPIGKRSPFQSFLTATAADKIARTPLQKYDIAQFRLVGLIWAIENPIAQVEDPKGVRHVVEIGTYIGKNWGKVTSISDNSVIITEEYTTNQGELFVETIEMRLRNTDLK